MKAYDGRNGKVVIDIILHCFSCADYMLHQHFYAGIGRNIPVIPEKKVYENQNDHQMNAQVNIYHIRKTIFFVKLPRGCKVGKQEKNIGQNKFQDTYYEYPLYH